MKTIEVSQYSEPGKLGLKALLSRFSGPLHALNSMNVNITMNEETISVSLYDLSCSLNSGDKIYRELKQYF